MLLGKIHVALLTLLLSDIEVELTNGFSPHLNKSCNFLALLHSVSYWVSLPHLGRLWIIMYLLSSIFNTQYRITNNLWFIYFSWSINSVFILIMIWQVESQEYSLDFWRRSLNSLTWIEILRQVLVASGFGSKHGSLRKEVLSKVFQSLYELPYDIS